MKLRNYFFIPLLSFSLFIFFTPTHADIWKKMKDKAEDTWKDAEKDSDDNDAPDLSGKWVDYTGNIPDNAVPAGIIHNQPVFVCQATYNNDIHPGRITNDGHCLITYGGSEIRLPIDAILVGHHYHWEDAGPDNSPPGEIEGGYENGGSLYICQAPFEGNVYPGKVVAGNCNIGAHGVEIIRQEYKVLVRD
jgi:hypothetical protein